MNKYRLRITKPSKLVPLWHNDHIGEIIEGHLELVPDVHKPMYRVEHQGRSKLIGKRYVEAEG